MLIKDLEELEREVVNDVIERRQLGGFDVNAGIILRLAERQYKIIGHLLEQEHRKAERNHAPSKPNKK